MMGIKGGREGRSGLAGRLYSTELWGGGGDMLVEVSIESIGSSFLFVKGNFFGEGFGHLCLFWV